MTTTAYDEEAAVAASSSASTAMQDRINKMINMQRLQSDVVRERMMTATANDAAVAEAGGVNNDSVNSNSNSNNKVAAAKSDDSSSSSSLRIVLPSPRWTTRRSDDNDHLDDSSLQRVVTRDDSSFWTAAGSQQSMMTTIASNAIDHHDHHPNHNGSSNNGLLTTAINGHGTKKKDIEKQQAIVGSIGGIIGNISKPRMKPRCDTTTASSHKNRHEYYGGMDSNDNDPFPPKSRNDDNLPPSSARKVREGTENTTATATTTTTNQEYEVRMRKHRRRVMYTIICHPFHRWYENLHSTIMSSSIMCCCICNSSSSSSMLMSTLPSRAICCGAIDGLLTGLGILMACLGLGLSSLTPTTTGAGEDTSGSSNQYYTKEDVNDAIIIVALTLAATSSDAICMAIGHVWSSILVTNMTQYERTIGMQSFHTNRARTKARLIDALMISGGMLKIDAFSLADTLEGYPDLFVSALLGGAICEEVVVDDGDNDDDDDEEEPLVDVGTSYYTAASSSYVVRNHHHHANNHNNDGTTTQSSGPNTLPEVVEGQIEAIFTMCSFIVASLIPSVTYALLIHYAANVAYNNQEEEVAVYDNGSNNYSTNDDDKENNTLLFRHSLFSPAQVSIVISALVMFLLGTWKR